MADRLQVSAATMSAIENGKTGVSAERIARLAEELGVPVQRLFGAPDAEPLHPGPVRAGAGASLDRKAHLSRHAPPADWRSFPPLVMDQALRGALSAFLEFGYHGATMRTIAQRANISVAGLYHYYASKQDMLGALLDLTMTDLHLRSFAAREQGRDPVERFACSWSAWRCTTPTGASSASSAPARCGASPPRRAAEWRPCGREQQRMVDEEVEQAVQSGAFRTTRPRQAARAVVTMCTALPQWFRDTGPASAEQVAAEYVEFALDLVRCVVERPHRPVP